MTKWTIKQGDTTVHDYDGPECTYNFPENTGETDMKYSIMVVDDNNCQKDMTFIIPPGEDCKYCDPNITLRIACVDCTQYVYIENEKACPGTTTISLNSLTSSGKKYLTDDIVFNTETIHDEFYAISNSKDRTDAYEGLVKFKVGDKDVEVMVDSYCGCVITVSIAGYYDRNLFSMTIDGNTQQITSNIIKYYFGDVNKSLTWGDVSFDIRNGFIAVDGFGSSKLTPSKDFASCCNTASVEICKYAKVKSVSQVTDTGVATITVDIENENYDEDAHKKSISVYIIYSYAESNSSMSGTWDTYTCENVTIDLVPGIQYISGVNVTKHTGNGNGNKDTLVRVEMLTHETDSNVYFVSGEQYYIDLYYYNNALYD